MKRKEVLGLPVILKDTGRILGMVTELCYIPGEARLRGLYYQTGAVMKRTCLMPLSRIWALGQHAVLVRKGAAHQGGPVTDLLQLSVYTQDGRLMGKVSDLYFNPVHFGVEGLEIRRSLWDDLREGRPILRNPTQILCREGRLILPLEEDTATTQEGIP